MKKIITVMVLLLAAMVLLAGCQNKEAETQQNTAAATSVPTPETVKAKYDRAMSLFAQNKYAEAAAVFDELGGYEESTKLAMYCKAADAGDKGDYNTAISGFQVLKDFKESEFMITYYQARWDEDSASKNPEQAWRAWVFAVSAYDSISLFRDSGARAEACRKAAYDYAVQLGNAKDYESAVNILSALGSYSDCVNLGKYYAALLLEQQGDYISASKAFSLIYDYRDAGEQSEKVLERGYDVALAKREAQDWDGAVKIFSNLRDYSDAKEQINATRYAEAESLEATGKQEEAYKLFISLGDYSDAYERANKSYYEEGIAKREAQDWDGAVDAFNRVYEYSDAKEQIKATKYAEGMAKREAGKWEAAVRAFEEAGDYSDAKEQINVTRYAEGAAKREAQDWDGAVKVFTDLGDYSDAKEQINMTRYAEAESLEAAGKREEAYTLFISLGDYSDAYERAYKPYYEKGLANREAGRWNAAVAAFKHAGDYSDAKEQIKETLYQQALNIYDDGDYSTAYEMLKALSNYKNADILLKNDLNLIAAHETKIAPYKESGNVVTFGTYPQTTGGKDRTPIEWIVLEYDETKHRALLLSRYGLEEKLYNTKYQNITWEECTLRAWLNNEFLNDAFSMEEQSAILITEVDNSASQGYSKWDTIGGNNTWDWIFLLSCAEANKYLDAQHWSIEGADQNSKSRVAPTEYAISTGAEDTFMYKTTDGKSAGWWWLRSPGNMQNNAAHVDCSGRLSTASVALEDFGVVRPAFWLNLESDYF